MRQFNHPHILSFHSSFVHNFDIFLVAPIMCYCSCRDAMNNFFTTGLPEIIVSFILRDVLFGLEYLHKKGFIHRSIRASHILINKTKAVLCGFRECTSMLAHGERAKSLYELPPASVKGLNWLAPEVLEQNLLGYTEKSDVYRWAIGAFVERNLANLRKKNSFCKTSVGITTCELANSLEPFSDMPTTFMLTEKIRGHQPALLDFSTCPEDVLSKSIENDKTDKSIEQ